MIKKPKLMKKIIKTKWVVLALSCIFLVVVYRTIDIKSLNNSAIVVGMAIDYFEDTKEFEVSTQVITIKGTTATGNTETDYTCYTEKATSLTDAIDKITEESGKVVSLTHCNVIFIGKSVFKLNQLQLFQPLTGPYYLPERAIMVTGNLPPKDLLSKRVASTTSSSLYLENLLTEPDGDKPYMNEYMAKIKSKSRTVVIPYIEATELEEDPLNDTDAIKDNYKFKIEKIMAFNNESSIILPSELSEATSILLIHNLYQSLSQKMPDGEVVQFKIDHRKTDFKVVDKTVIANVTLNLSYLEAQHVKQNSPIRDNDKIVKEAQAYLKNNLEKKLLDSYELSKKSNIDYFNILTRAFQHYGYKMNDDAFQTYNLKPVVKLAVEEHK